MFPRRYFHTAVIFILYFAVFSQSKLRSPDFLYKLSSRADFDLLKGDPLSKNFNGIECIKLVYVLETKKLFYLESKRYKWHHRFTEDVLHDEDNLEQFNLKNYSNTSERKYILATFNYNVNSKNYFLQFAACDNPSEELIKILTEKVAATFFKGSQFKLLLNSTILLKRKNELAKIQAVQTSDEIYKNQVFQPICTGKASGILKFIHADSVRSNVNYSDYILILNGNSNSIPVCKAVVTNEFQTPLSHICLLTNNRRTPSAAQRNIFEIDSLKKLDGSFAQISVDKEGLKILPISGSYIQAKSPKKQLKLDSDTLLKEIINLQDLRYKNKVAFGSKTCNLAELCRVKFKGKNLVTPVNAFGIPFGFYRDHIRKNKIASMISECLKDTLVLNNDSLLDKRLKMIRTAIRKTPIDKDLLSSVETQCKQRFGNSKIRFRSSSNCEDEANFNGAGLYTSETGIVGDSTKLIEAAIKKVWASLWTTRAFKERAFFNIDHSTVNMAVLVHPAVDDEIINGVAVTKNLYRSYDFGFVINMQKGEEEVVSPKNGMVCEQVVSYMNNTYADFYNKYRSADWISFSNLSPNSSLLSEDELMDLTLQLESIKKHFYSVYNKWPSVQYRDFALDIEFKLVETNDKKRVFLFKQARPYN